MTSAEWWIDALWRNGLALVPVALLAWAFVHFMARRPATRHVIWLGALSWLVVGLLLPPLQLAPTESDVGIEHNVTPASPEKLSDNFPNLTLAADLPDVFSLVAASDECDSSINASIVTRRLSNDWETLWRNSIVQRDDGYASDTTSDYVLAEHTVRSDVVSRDERQQNPTPPTTIARSYPRASHVYPSTDGSVGQSSPTISKLQDDVIAAPLVEPNGQLNVTSTALPHDLDSPINSGAWEERVAPSSSPDRVAEKHVANIKPLTATTSNAADSRSAAEASSAPTGLVESIYERFASYLGFARSLSLRLAAMPRLPIWLWLGVTCIIILIRAWNCIRFSRRLHSVRPAPHAVQALVDECAKLIALRSVPIAQLVPHRLSPLILCFPRPRLIIPVELWNDLDADGRRVVVLHELAHLKRRDHWTHWFNELAGALYWWHPFVWWMRHRIADEAENACDMWVTWLAPTSRRAYATALVQAQQFLSHNATPTPASAVGILSPQAQRIARRLTMIMTHRNAPRSSSFGYLCIPALLLAAWIAAPAHSQTPAAEAPTPPTVDGVLEVPGAPASPYSIAVGSNGIAGDVVVLQDATDAPRIAVVGKPPHAHAHSVGSGVARVRVHDHDDHHADHDRLAHLEAQIARLSEQVERLSTQIARAPAQPPAPSTGLRVYDNKLPQFVRRPKPVPTSELFPGGKTLTRRYQLPEGKREALNKLMSRSDVPILMRPQRDGIEVIGTAAQQEVFARFVKLISGEGMDHRKSYEVPAAQMEDLRALMIRDDVPVLVNPADSSITVHGNELIQESFRAFIEMIQPKGAKVSVGSASAPQSAEFRIATGQYQAAQEALREAEMAKRSQERALKTHKRNVHMARIAQAKETLRRRARELEAKADQMEARSQEVELQLRKAKEIRSQLDSRKAIEELERQIAELRDVKAELDNEANEIYEEAAEAEAEIEELEDELNDDE